MKKIIFSLLILVSGIAYGQGGYVKPNNSYGTISNRASIDSTLFFPTGCGAPSLRGYNLRKSAQYFDSCAAQFWIYNPSTSLWDTLHVGAAASSGWGLTGNAGTTAGTNFIGTTDSVDFVGKTNNTERFRWNARGALAVGSGTDYGTSGQALISQGIGTPNTWKNIQDGWYNIVRDGNADTTGISDVSSIIQNAINAGWKNIFIPKGSFLVSAQIQMADSVNIKGAGRLSSSIKLASDITAFKCSYSQGGNRATFQDFGFYGNYATGGGTSQYGIFIDSAQAILVDGISGNNIGGYVVSIRYNGNCCADYITRASKSNTITNSYFISNYGAVQFNTRAEYNIISNSTFTSNVYAIYSDGGNNRIEGNSVVKNTYGFYMVGGSNNGHGLATGNTVNHNGTNLYMNGVTLGYNFFNNSFSQNNSATAGLIEMISSSFVNFTGGYLINDTVRMTGCTNVTFNGVRKYYSAFNPVWVIVSGEAPTVFNVGDSVNTITLKDVVASKKIDVSLPASLTGDWKQVYPDKSGTFAMTSDITGGTVTGTGTANTMTKWTGTSAIGNSLITDNGTLLSFGGGINMGGNSITGNTTSGGNLTLLSTSNATKGKIIFGNAGTTAYDAVNNRLGVGTSSPSGTLEIKAIGTTSASTSLSFINSSSANLFSVRDDGYVKLGSGSTNSTLEIIGSSSAGIYSPAYSSGSNSIIRYKDYNGNTRMSLDMSSGTTGNLGINVNTPAAKLDVLGTTEQLRLKYDASNYVSYTVGSSGALTVAPTGASITVTKPFVLKGYTVATLPTGVIGMTAYVSDALTPTFGTTLVGGGAVVAKAFFDGTNWINE